VYDEFGVGYKALIESAEPYFQPGEEVLAVDWWSGRRGIEKLPMIPGLQLTRKQMGVVVTSRRFLTFRVRGVLVDTARELLTDLPLADVDSITVASRLAGFEATLTVRGVAYRFLTPHISHTRALAEKVAQARAAP
jgi:hypothetical protein